MTAATAELAEQPVTTGSRIAAVLRMSTVDVRTRLAMPWMILAAIFAVNLAIFWAVAATVGDGDGGNTGALTALLFIVGSTYLVAMTQVMPFALSLGITRRHFYTGIWLVMLAETLLHSIVTTVLLGVERLTGGWGIGMNFFSLSFMPQGNPVLQVLCYWVPLLTIGAVFIAMGAVFRRWGQYGVWMVGIVTVLVLGIAVFGVTWTESWPVVGRFFEGTPVPALLAGYPLVLAAVAAVGGFLVVRRARP